MSGSKAAKHKGEIAQRTDKMCGNGVSRPIAEQLAAHSIKRKTLKPDWIIENVKDGKGNRVSREQAAKICTNLEAAELIQPVKSAGNFTTANGPVKSAFRFSFPAYNINLGQWAQLATYCSSKKMQKMAGDEPWRLKECRAELDALDAWLAGSFGKPIVPVSDHERCYEIWGDEKALETKSRSPQLNQLLTDLDFDRTALKFYKGSQVFASYALRETGKVVISENRDMFDALKKLLRRTGHFDLLGEQISGTVFGGGTKASNSALGVFLEEEEIDPSQALYVGDIDPAGIAIQQAVEDRLGIVPFVPLYELMTEMHALRKEKGLPCSPYLEEQRKDGYCKKRFLRLLDEGLREEAKTCLESSVRIPQEIVSYAVLEGMVG